MKRFKGTQLLFCVENESWKKTQQQTRKTPKNNKDIESFQLIPINKKGKKDILSNKVFVKRVANTSMPKSTCGFLNFSAISEERNTKEKSPTFQVLKK